MHGSRPSTIRAGSLLVLLVMALLIAACGTDSAAQPMEGDDGAEIPLEGSAGAGDEEPAEQAGSGPPGSEPFAAPIEQRIVKTGEMTLEVRSVAEVLGRVRALAVELGGYVGGSQAGTLDERASLTIRIPATTFDTAIARLHELDGSVIAEATREEDVTGQVVDLAARIDNLQASEASYRELVARAERIEDILAVQSRLDQVRGEIEQLQAQLDALEGQAALSTLTITLVPQAEPVQQQTETWNPGTELDRAIASLVGIGQGLVDLLIWFGIVWLPVLLVLAAIGLVALRGVLEVRRRTTPAPIGGGSNDGEGAA